MRPRTICRGVVLFPARTPTLPPATHTNSYALGRSQVVLVEPATLDTDERMAWLEWARAIQRQSVETTIVGILATHHHIDHGMSSGFFCRELDVPLLAHEVTIQKLLKLDVDLEDVTVKLLVDHQPVTENWNALHTPGHAPGHVCVYSSQLSTLIAGDMVANGSSIVIPPDDGGDMAEYLRQLARLDELNTHLLLPAHGEPIDEPHDLLQKYIAHRLTREAKVLAAFVAQKATLGRIPTAFDITPLAYDDTPKHLWLFAAASAEAHLVKLRREGVV